MKVYRAIAYALLLGAAVVGAAQDWKPCTATEKSIRATVEAFNATHTGGPQLRVDCVYSGEEPPKVPVRHFLLSPGEMHSIAKLRSASDQAFRTQDKYEHFLIRKYVPNAPKITDRCWYFVGFVLDDNFITEDRNTGFPYPNCFPIR